MREALSNSGGPFLFGPFGIVDAMYLPVLARFETYGIPLPPELRPYVDVVMTSPAVVRLLESAREAPAIPIYDAYVQGLGGEILLVH